MKVDIDEALRSYVDCAAPLGMEARVMLRIRRRWVWQWPLLGLAAAGLSCLVWVRPVTKSMAPAPIQSVKVVDAGQKSGGRAEALPHHGRRHKPNGVNALWRFAQEHPEAALQLTAVYNSKPIELLQIEPILIEELETDQR